MDNSAAPTTPEPSGTPTPSTERVAPHPFDDPSADVILRSSDRVNFRLFKPILSYASGFFRDLFALGPVPTDDEKQTSLRPIPIIDVAENSVTLTRVLLWCYPVPHTVPQDFPTVQNILEAAIKYDMTGVISHMHPPLRDLRTAYPGKVFAISCIHYLSDIASDAAEALKTQFGKLPSAQDGEWSATIARAIYIQDFGSIRAASFLRLLKFASSFPEIYLSINIEYPDGDLIIRSQLDPSPEFRVHSKIISFSSSVLKDIIRSKHDGTSAASDAPNTTVVELPEGSTILGLLLASCYPSDEFDMISFDPANIPLLAEASKKYGVKRATRLCQERLAELVLTDPFRAYYLAIKCDWKVEARDVAVHLAQRCTEEEYHPCMENMDAKFYYCLLKFCHEYRRIVSSIRTKFSKMSVDFSNAPSISTAFAQCKELATGENTTSSLRDTAFIMSLLTTTGGSSRSAFGSDTGSVTVRPVERLEGVYKEITEKLAELQIEMVEHWGSFGGKVKKKRKSPKGSVVVPISNV